MEFSKAALALSAVIIKCAVDKCINNLLDFRISLIKLLRIVAFILKSFNIFYSCTEDILVLFACALCDFDVSSVICAEDVYKRQLSHLANILGIDMQNTCACGNADNDADMIAESGFGAAVEAVYKRQVL